DGLDVFYQPRYDVPTRTLVGAEALVRWRHPTLGEIAPYEFVAIAEEAGLVDRIDRFVLTRVCSQVRSWRDAALEVRVSVNISPRHLRHGDVPGAVHDAVTAAGIPAAHLELDLHESLAAGDTDGARVRLLRLKVAGVRLALDGFGTGYSAVGALRHLPFDAVKLDRQLIADLDTEGGRRVVAALVSLGHGFGFDVAAVGVESPEQLAVLGEVGCDTAQGYHLGTPMSADQLTSLWVAAAQEARPPAAR
ncbi:MAG: EAL domain-containing protein, partial [Frankia sp.]|nr:EAL domain-containing protein [Frankia sp.]